MFILNAWFFKYRCLEIFGIRETINQIIFIQKSNPQQKMSFPHAFGGNPFS